MSNTNMINDFYQVPDLSFDINKLRQDLNKKLHEKRKENQQSDERV